MLDATNVHFRVDLALWMSSVQDLIGLAQQTALQAWR